MYLGLPSFVFRTFELKACQALPSAAPIQVSSPRPKEGLGDYQTQLWLPNTGNVKLGQVVNIFELILQKHFRPFPKINLFCTTCVYKKNISTVCFLNQYHDCVYMANREAKELQIFPKYLKFSRQSQVPKVRHSKAVSSSWSSSCRRTIL